MADIHVSQESIQNMLRKLKIFAEDSASLLMTSKRALAEAEISGWKDESFFRFKDEFENMSRKYADAIKEVEENLIPRLNHINTVIDSF